MFVPAAGIPWYVTLFGRDSLVVAMESIGGFPEFATGALDRLAAYQATTDDPEQDREPGKVPHELRFGELAELGLLPFAPYYGTHDATPLFMVVLSYAYEWSADKRLLRRYRPAAEAALRWMLESGDRDGDGYQEYATRSTRGLFNQGWKDSAVAIQHEDGRIPSVPIALCELQAYAFDALLRMARIREAFGDDDGSHELRTRARRLLRPVQRRLLVGERGHLLPRARRRQAADPVRGLECRPLPRGGSRPARPRGSRRRPADGADMWTGWGIRTLSADHPGYNPYSYHLGSVWPHYNATIAGGFRAMAGSTDAQRVAEGIFAAADLFESHRLPELFAGLDREPGGFPVQYLGANVPQAWAAASVFRFVAILCGIHAHGSRRRVYVNPDLPDWLPSITLRNLRAGKGAMDLRMERGQCRCPGQHDRLRGRPRAGAAPGAARCGRARALRRGSRRPAARACARGSAGRRPARSTTKANIARSPQRPRNRWPWMLTPASASSRAIARHAARPVVDLGQDRLALDVRVAALVEDGLRRVVVGRGHDHVADVADARRRRSRAGRRRARRALGEVGHRAGLVLQLDDELLGHRLLRADRAGGILPGGRPGPGCPGRSGTRAPPDEARCARR